MSDSAGNAGMRHRRRWTVAAVVLVLVAAAPATLGAREHAPFAARAGLELAAAAAASWSQDATLVYLENDEPLDAHGAAARWGYLFHSPTLGKARAYSVRDGKILVAEHLEMQFDAPPVAGQWIDSGAALAAAELGAAGAFRRDHGGRLSTMLLMRSAFEDGDPDRTTWTLVYASPEGPSLFVVLDAADGKVRRTWRG
jgi:hypothetical protein